MFSLSTLLGIQLGNLGSSVASLSNLPWLSLRDLLSGSLGSLSMSLCVFSMQPLCIIYFDSRVSLSLSRSLSLSLSLSLAVSLSLSLCLSLSLSLKSEYNYYKCKCNAVVVNIGKCSLLQLLLRDVVGLSGAEAQGLR